MIDTMAPAVAILVHGANANEINCVNPGTHAIGEDLETFRKKDLFGDHSKYCQLPS